MRINSGQRCRERIPSSRRCGYPERLRFFGLGLVFVLLFTGTGCRTLVHEFNQHSDHLAAWWNSRASKPEELSDVTWELLRFWELDTRYVEDRHATLRQAASMFAGQPGREWAYALAEISFLSGRKAERSGDLPLAGEHYYNATCYAYYFLFEGEDNAQFDFDRRNTAVFGFYNQGVEKCLALAMKQKTLNPAGPLRLPFTNGELVVAMTGPGMLRDGRPFDELLFAHDFTPSDHIKHQNVFGLGVPLVGVRHLDGKSIDQQQQFLKDRHPFAVTAFLKPDISRITPHVRKPAENGIAEPQRLESARHVPTATLELYDPMRGTEIEVAGRTVPLEADLAAPMSYVLKGTDRRKLEFGGFFEPESVQEYAGLHMFEPYQEGKIPVVFVHGLLSGPVTWSEMFRELWQDPEIRDNYQFWFFLYPTGTPFVSSAGKLREELDEVIKIHGQHDPAINHMVLIGHSMGGLVSKLQVTESQNKLWSLVSSVPIDQIRTNDESREILRTAFFFEPQPAVERVVFIGTPHKGSKLSQAPIGRIGSLLVRVPKTLRNMQRQLIRDNPNDFSESFSMGIPNSVDMLASDNPVLQTMAVLPYKPNVKLHSIVGTVNDNVIGRSTLANFLTGGGQKEPGDGVVPLDSARLPNADSELPVPATHGKVHRHPLTFHEVWRILREHLADVNQRGPIRQTEGSETEPTDMFNQPPTEASFTEDATAPIIVTPTPRQTETRWRPVSSVGN